MWLRNLEAILNKMGNFDKYPAYKDSGVEWLGKIPTGWSTDKGKWLFIQNARPVRNEDNIVTCFRDGQVTLRSNRRTDGFTNALKEHGYQGIRKGDLVIHAMDAFAGAIGVSDSDGKSTPVYSACTPFTDNQVNSFFYAYLLRNMAHTGFIESLAKGIRERSTDFRYNDFANLQFPLPTLPEQTAIAAFLDEKTVKIDTAIAQKEKMISLLKERKQILIQNAVTKGINPDAKMKDSGVEWIGEIPEGWEVKRLKYVLDERNERSEDGTEPLFMMSQVHGLVVRSAYHDKAEVASTTVGNKRVYKNDLVFNKLKAHLGVFFKSTIDEVGLVSPDYAVYLSKGIVTDLKYLEYLFRHPAYISTFICKATGIVEGLIRLYTHDLFSIKIPVPSHCIQHEILSFITTQSAKIDTAISIQQQQIAKLKEYKSILIDSAVTGKIKVC
jgi:type I restriction enzyme S subunit